MNSEWIMGRRCRVLLPKCGNINHELSVKQKATIQHISNYTRPKSTLYCDWPSMSTQSIPMVSIKGVKRRTKACDYLPLTRRTCVLVTRHSVLLSRDCIINSHLAQFILYYVKPNSIYICQYVCVCVLCLLFV